MQFFSIVYSFFVHVFSYNISCSGSQRCCACFCKRFYHWFCCCVIKHEVSLQQHVGLLALRLATVSTWAKKNPLHLQLFPTQKKILLTGIKSTSRKADSRLSPLGYQTDDGGKKINAYRNALQLYRPLWFVNRKKVVSRYRPLNKMAT